ncbi:UNVERIFIED_CONTAM: hypothetical protein Sangu_1781200 [Sesamum angustifolium]|uniref:Uncharacterized protein n=1 Tax=Sesamum angustifolium TaxID=2727405 RepID=A0AAW2M6B1_9LAMI
MGTLEGFSGSGGNGGLNLQHDRMASISKCDLTQSVEDPEHGISSTRLLVRVAHIRGSPLAKAARPGYG